MSGLTVPWSLRAQTIDEPLSQVDDPLSGHLGGLVPHWGELLATALLLIGYVSARGGETSLLTTVNVAGTGVLSIIMLWSALRMIRDNIHAIWTPLFAYRIAMMTYLGIGSLITPFLNSNMRDLLEAFFAFFPSDVLKFNTANALFHLVVIISTYVYMVLFRSFSGIRPLSGKIISTCNISLKSLGYIFLVLGMTINYLVIYPSTFGIIDFLPPNFAFQLGQIAYLSYFILTYWGLLNRKYNIVWMMIGLAGVDAVIGLLMLSKSSAILPMLMIPIAFIYHKASLRRLLLIAAIAIPYYSFVASIVYDARSRVERLGANNNPTFTETVTVLGEIAQGKQGSADVDSQLGWVRLSYVNAGSFAISRYDQGLNGDSLRDIFVVWVPRLIYPDKPIITDIGGEFNFLANGNPNSASSPTIPSEGYWDYGWLGVGLFAIVFAGVTTFGSIYTTIALQRGAWHLLLVTLIVTRIGARIDGMFVPDVIGPLSALLVVHLVCQMANRILPNIPLVQRRLA